MEIVWDRPKQIANLVKHGLDFALIDLDFFLGALVLEAHSGRFRALGRLADGRAVAVVVRPLGSEGLSITSLRPASAKERELLDE